MADDEKYSVSENSWYALSAMVLSQLEHDTKCLEKLKDKQNELGIKLERLSAQVKITWALLIGNIGLMIYIIRGA